MIYPKTKENILIANLKMVVLKDIDPEDFNTSIFNRKTVKIVLDELMTRGIQTASGDELVKPLSFHKTIDTLNTSEIFLTNAILKRKRLCSSDRL